MLNTDSYGYGVGWDIVRIGNIVFAYCGGIIYAENSNTAYELDVLIPDGYKPGINASATLCATVSSTIHGVSKMTYFASGKINIVSQKQGIQDVYHVLSWHTNDDMPE